MPTLDVRPEVAAFALLMEARLRANDHKPGWKNHSPDALYARLLEEAGELHRAILAHAFDAGPEQSDGVGYEAADVANFAMMIADVCGALELKEEPRG